MPTTKGSRNAAGGATGAAIGIAVAALAAGVRVGSAGGIVGQDPAGVDLVGLHVGEAHGREDLASEPIGGRDPAAIVDRDKVDAATTVASVVARPGARVTISTSSRLP